MEEQGLITRDGHILSGVPVFAGTRVPVKTLVEYLKKKAIRSTCFLTTSRRLLAGKPRR